jgi:hypothetical protein
LKQYIYHFFVYSLLTGYILAKFKVLEENM